jgi:hypothetical protein
MVKRSRQKYSKRFNFALTGEMHAAIHEIAADAKRDGVTEDAAEVVRRMIVRELPFFRQYVSRWARLPNGDTDSTPTAPTT